MWPCGLYGSPSFEQLYVHAQYLFCYRGILQKVQEQTSLSPSSSQSAASDEDPPGPTVRVGAEGIGGEGKDRGDILKEKPHLVNTDNVSVSSVCVHCVCALCVCVCVNISPGKSNTEAL